MAQASRTDSVAGKVFLLGEYAILSGLPALVAAIAPRFSAQTGVGPRVSVAEFHPASPAGLLLGWAAKQGANLDFEFEFTDPYAGLGGFGASTAQFALLYRTLAEREPRLRLALDWKSVWTLYRTLTEVPGAVPPSGADLVAQWQGGISWISPDRCEAWSEAADPSQFLIFSATSQQGRKVKTHDHLADLSRRGFLASNHRLMSDLGQVLERARGASSPAEFGASLSDYAKTLAKWDLEIPQAREDREAMSRVPGVLGVKGAGALLADAVVVLAAPSGRAEIIALAENRGLKLVADGISRERGI